MQISVGPRSSTSFPASKSGGAAASSTDQASTPKSAAASDGGAASDAAGSTGSSVAVDLIKKQIEQLKEALAKEQQQLSVASGRASRDPSAQMEMLGLQSAIKTTSSALATASAELAAAMQQEGGTSRGGLLDVVA